MTLGKSSKFRLFAGADAEEGAAAEPVEEAPAEQPLRPRRLQLRRRSPLQRRSPPQRRSPLQRNLPKLRQSQSHSPNQWLPSLRPQKSLPLHRKSLQRHQHLLQHRHQHRLKHRQPKHRQQQRHQHRDRYRHSHQLCQPSRELAMPLMRRSKRRPKKRQSPRTPLPWCPACRRTRIHESMDLWSAT